MSKCISAQGEYSEHTPGTEEFVCAYCFVLDEDAIRGEVDRLRSVVTMEKEIGEAFKLAAQDISKQSAAEIATLWKALNSTAAPQELWEHAVCCITGSGCTHDSEADCADSLLSHARELHRTLEKP